MSTSPHRKWAFLLGLGVLFLILGVIGLSMTMGLTLVSMFFLGTIVIIAGIAQLADAFKSKPWKGTLIHTGIAMLYIFAGCLVIRDPVLASSLITLFLGYVFVIIGVSRIILFFILCNTQGRVWALLGGLTSFILGLLILMQWPYSGLWVIGLFIAIELLVNGWFYIFWAFSMRNQHEK